MAGFMVIYIAPGIDTSLLRPEGWDATFETGATVEAKRDRFELSDTEPDAEYPLNLGEWIAEVRPIADPGGAVDGEGNPVIKWRVRIRYVDTVNDTRGGIAPLYTLSDERLPDGWGNAARFFSVHTTAAKHKLLHDHIYTELGYGPVAGAWAAQDPADSSQFLPDAVRTAIDMSNQEFLTRIGTVINQLTGLGYTPNELQAIVDSPAGKTEDDTIRALVHDLEKTMAQLKNAGMRT